MMYRFQIHFDNLSYIDNAEMELMTQIGVLSPLERVNAVRISHGMTQLTQAQYEANRRAAMQEELEVQEESAKIEAKYHEKAKATSSGAKAK